MTRPADTLDTYIGTKDDNWAQGIESEMYGFRGDDHLFTMAGTTPVTMWGGRGDDYLQGGQGGDTFYGGRGKDTLIGIAGEDRLYGGKGADTFVIYEGDEHKIMDYQPNKDVISVVSVPDID